MILAFPLPWIALRINSAPFCAAFLPRICLLADLKLNVQQKTIGYCLVKKNFFMINYFYRYLIGHYIPKLK